MKSRDTRRGAIFVGSAAALWGLWPFWVRQSGESLGAAAVALLVAGVGCLPWMWRERRRRGRGARDFGLMVLLGVSDAANAGLYFMALDRGAVAPAVVSHYLAPVFVAVMAPLVLGEPRSRMTPPALLMALAGTVAIATPGSDAEGSVTIAILLGGTSAVFYATNVLISRHLGPRFTDHEILGYHAFVSAALLFLASGITQGIRAWAWLLTGSVPSSLVAGLLFLAGLRKLRAEQAGVLTYLEPASAMVVGVVLLDERFTLLPAAGAMLVLGAGLLVIVGSGPTPKGD